MSLADIKVVRESVSFRGGKFEVRAFSLDDVTEIMRDDFAGINDVLSLYNEQVPENVAVSATMQFIVRMIARAPDLAARIIATAADERDFVDAARALPIPVQVEAIQKVLKLTFDEWGGPKKFAENFQALGNLLTPQSPPQHPNGSPT